MMDSVLGAWVSGLIELNKLEWMLGRGHSWKPGNRLKLLFAGYWQLSISRIQKLGEQLRNLVLRADAHCVRKSHAHRAWAESVADCMQKAAT